MILGMGDSASRQLDSRNEHRDVDGQDRSFGDIVTCLLGFYHDMDDYHGVMNNQHMRVSQDGATPQKSS